MQDACLLSLCHVAAVELTACVVTELGKVSLLTSGIMLHSKDGWETENLTKE